jgi:hypothetical protein
MNQFLTDLASKSGVDSDHAHQGVADLLAHLKDRLDPAAFEHLKNAIPNCDDLMAAMEAKLQSAGGGVLEAVKSMAGKLIAGTEPGASTAVETKPEDAGLASADLQNLLPKLHDMLASKLPAHVIDQIQQHVPGFAPTSSETRSM